MIYCSNFSGNSSLQHIRISNICLSHQDLQMEILKGEVLGHLNVLEAHILPMVRSSAFSFPNQAKGADPGYACVSLCMYKVSSAIHALNTNPRKRQNTTYELMKGNLILSKGFF